MQDREMRLLQPLVGLLIVIVIISAPGEQM